MNNDLTNKVNQLFLELMPSIQKLIKGQIEKDLYSSAEDRQVRVVGILLCLSNALGTMVQFAQDVGIPGQIVMDLVLKELMMSQKDYISQFVQQPQPLTQPVNSAGNSSVKSN